VTGRVGVFEIGCSACNKIPIAPDRSRRNRAKSVVKFRSVSTYKGTHVRHEIIKNEWSQLLLMASTGKTRHCTTNLFYPAGKSRERSVSIFKTNFAW
jgi:hypothetical protein